MPRFARRLPSPAMIVAMTALVVALAGSAYAATLGPNTVGAIQLRNSGVTAPKLATDAVTQRAMGANSVGAAEIIRNSVGTGDLQVGAVTNGTIATRAVSNNKIGTNQVGARALRGFVIRTRSATVSGGSPAAPVAAVAAVQCGRGEQAVGVGTSWNGGGSENVVTSWARFVTTRGGVPTGATARGLTSIAPARAFTVQVACVLP